MPHRKRNHLLARNTATVANGLRRIWLPKGGSTNGIEIGIMLVEVFYTANPYVTAGYLFERMLGAHSVDTIRRRLEQMVDEGVAEVMEVGGRKLYRAEGSAAQRSIDAMQEAVALGAQLLTG